MGGRRRLRERRFVYRGVWRHGDWPNDSDLETPLRRYSEGMLLARLEVLPTTQRRLFAVGCAELLLSEYREGAVGHDSATLMAALDLAWRCVEHVPTDVDIDREIALLSDSMPDPDEYSDQNAIVENVYAAAIYALRCVRSGASQDAIWAARQGYEAADLQAQLRLNPDLNAPGAEQRLLASSEVQTALAAQEKLLDILDSSTELDLPMAQQATQIRNKLR